MAQTGDVIDLKQVRAQADEALVGLVADKRKALREARFQRQLGQLQKTHVLGQMRRDIARIETELSARLKGKQGE